MNIKNLGMGILLIGCSNNPAFAPFFKSLSGVSQIARNVSRDNSLTGTADRLFFIMMSCLSSIFFSIPLAF